MLENLSVHACSPDVVTRYIRVSFFTGCKPANTGEREEREAQEEEIFHRLRSGPWKSQAGTCRPCQHEVGEIRPREMWCFFCTLMQCQPGSVPDYGAWSWRWRRIRWELKASQGESNWRESTSLHGTGKELVMGEWQRGREEARFAFKSPLSFRATWNEAWGRKQ